MTRNYNTASVVHTHTYTQTDTRTCTCTCTHTYIHTYIHTCTHTYIHVQLRCRSAITPTQASDTSHNPNHQIESEMYILTAKAITILLMMEVVHGQRMASVSLHNAGRWRPMGMTRVQHNSWTKLELGATFGNSGRK